MKELSLSKNEFAEWFDSVNNDVVKHYKFDKYHDIRVIMNMRHEATKYNGKGDAQTTMYWACKDIGTVLRSDFDGFKRAVNDFGCKVRFKLDFDFDDSSGKPFCVVTKL